MEMGESENEDENSDENNNQVDDSDSEKVEENEFTEELKL